MGEAHTEAVVALWRERLAELEAALATARETNTALNRRNGELEHQLARDANERTGGWRRDCLALGQKLEETRAALATAVAERQRAEREREDLRKLLDWCRPHLDKQSPMLLGAVAKATACLMTAAAPNGEASEGAALPKPWPSTLPAPQRVEWKHGDTPDEESGKPPRRPADYLGDI